MALTFGNIKKWWKMITGKSILHVNQDEGKNYSFLTVAGYYNNLTEKVTKDKNNYESWEVIKCIDEKNQEYYFPIAVFQYGLGAYDLLLQRVDCDLMNKKFMSQLEWALSTQNEDGSWLNFSHTYPDSPFSAMAQGEGCSLLIRGYILTKNEAYLKAAKKALDFMLLPLSEGGTTEYTGDDIILYEFTCFPYVYNGWMFAIFGLMDYVIFTKDKKYKIILDKTILSLTKRLEAMDNGYWSMYRNDKTIASPFYHHLHIAQLSVLYKYTKNEKFNYYCEKFKLYESKRKNKRKAFLKKAIQKIRD